MNFLVRFPLLFAYLASLVCVVILTVLDKCMDARLVFPLIYYCEKELSDSPQKAKRHEEISRV